MKQATTVTKAVIKTGGHQYLVKVGDQLQVELLPDQPTEVEFKPLLVIDGSKVSVGQPTVAKASVVAKIIAADVLQPKVLAIRYKPKKRVRKIRGHRQRLTTIEIVTIKTGVKA